MKKLTFLFFLNLMFAAPATFSQTGITGQVTDANSHLLAGISIHILNTNYGAVSNSEGNYVFSKILPGRYILIFSSIGYTSKTEEINVNSQFPRFCFLNQQDTF